jgi:hypothetical protein
MVCFRAFTNIRFSSFWAYYPLKNLFSPHKIRGKKDTEKNRNSIAASLHPGHDKSFGVPGA